MSALQILSSVNMEEIPLPCVSTELMDMSVSAPVLMRETNVKYVSLLRVGSITFTVFANFTRDGFPGPTYPSNS